MKKLYCLFLLLSYCSASFAQSQIDSALRFRIASPNFHDAADTVFAKFQAANPSDTNEGGAVNNFNRWRSFMGSRESNDVPLGGSVFAPLERALGYYMNNSPSYCSGGASFKGDWHCLGPFSNYYSAGYEQQGRITALWVDPADTNIILAGADAGGLWKSTNHGLSWHNISDGPGSFVPGTMGVAGIAVNPFKKNIIYLSLAIPGYQYEESLPYGIGLAYTPDGGAHWYQDTAFNTVAGINVYTGQDVLVRMAYMPGTQKLFATYGGTVLYKGDSADTWHDITPSSAPISAKWFLGIGFSKQTAGKFIVSGVSFNDTGYLYVYDTVTVSWSILKLILPSAYFQVSGRTGPADFSVTSTDTALIRFSAKKASDSSNVSLLVSTPLSTAACSVVNNDFSGNITQFQVSDSNSNIIYAANYFASSFLISTDGGQSFTDFSSGHPDGRCLYVYSSSRDAGGIHDVVYLGTDGGIRKKRYGSYYAASITGDSLAITEFYGFGNTEANENYIASGAQDNGTFSYIKNRTNEWNVDDGGVDGYVAKFMKKGLTEVIGERNTPGLNQITFSGNTTTVSYPNIPPETADIIRPIYFDDSNNAFIGYEHVWQRRPGNSSWENAFHADPRSGIAVSCFYIDPDDSNQAYIAYRRPAGVDPTISGNGRLFYSYSAKQLIPNWTNISPSILQYDGVNTLEVDPHHSNRVWIGLGEVNYSYASKPADSMKNRVLYSDDYGNTWQDVSRGLPPLPVNKILYRNGSDDDLFAGTDVGVFRWSKSDQKWYCFNDGLPTCIVMDMEFNYCAGKLRLATYGRGIWETDVLGTDNPGLSDTISSNTTWGDDRYITGGILVKNGNTLTIKNSTIHMPRKGLIVVQPGAYLHIVNSTLTNDCENCLWGGIEVVGNANLPQTPYSNQGWLRVEGNSVIAHALVGVTNWDGQDSNTTGGIVQAYNSSFVNNYLAVSLQPYVDIYTSAPLYPDLSNFSTCNFTVDNGLKTSTDGNHYHGMVYMNGVAGVGFTGCVFANRDTAAAVQWLGYGIFAHNTDFSLIPACNAYAGSVCTNWQRCYFSGFEEGVHAEGTVITDPSFDVSIDQSDFDSCSVGVRLATTNAGTVSRCNFNVGRGKWVTDFDSVSCHENIGVLVQNANAFFVEADTFYGYANGGGYSDWRNLGVVVENTGGNGNKVYKNTFYGMNIGCYAYGNNGGYYTGPSAHSPQQPSTGLRIECNSFNNDTADIYVAGNWAALSGIFYIQGGQDSSTHNIFYPSGSIYNYGSGVTYYYDSTPGNHNKPLHSYGVTLSGTGGNGGCPLDFNPAATYKIGRAGPTQIGNMKSSFYTYQASYASDVATYKGLLDAGNTDSLVYVIAHATNPTMLYVSLSSISPYLSESSLWALKDVTILSHANYVGILGMNPETLRDSIFLSALQSYSGNPLTVSEVAALRANSKTSTARSALESRMAEENQAMNDNAANLLRVFRTDHDTSGSCTVTMDSANVWFLRDSNSYFVYADSIGAWLQNTGSAAAQYQLAGYYSLFAPRDSSGLADSAISHAANYIAPSDSIGKVENSHVQSLWKVLKALETSNRSIYDMTTTETDSISALAPNGPGDLGQVTALEIINIVSTGPPSPGPVHPFPITCYSYSPPVEPKPGRSNSKTDTTKINTKPEYPVSTLRAGCTMRVYPNPASSVVNFWYAVPDMQGKMTLRICDAIGKEIKRFEANGNEELMNWEIEGAAPGMYIYTLSDEQGIVGIGKLVIER